MSVRVDHAVIGASDLAVTVDFVSALGFAVVDERELSAQQAADLYALPNGTTEVVLEGDESALHLVAERSGEVVAVSSWFSRAHPTYRGREGRQLRTMASAPEARGTGAATVLLADGLDRARTEGADHVWARARMTALGFYRRAGFVTLGEEYVDETTGLPHIDIVLDL